MKNLTAQRLARLLGPLIVLLLVFSLLLSVVSGSSECEVSVEIYGRLLNEEGQPMVDQELLFTFFVSPEKRDQQARATTDRQGEFLLEAQVAQSAYQNAGRQCMEIQGRMFLPKNATQVHYQPGSKQQMIPASEYASWTTGGNYEGESLRLFHSLRGGAGEDGGEFTDMTILLGTKEEPCRFQLSPGPTVTDVKIHLAYLDAQTSDPVAAPETYLLTKEQLTADIPLKEVKEMAPLLVEAGGRQIDEAYRGNPLTTVNPADLLKGSADETIAVFVYYHQDRDDDGIPDYEITEQYLTAKDEPVPGQAERVQLYAHRDIYQAQLAQPSGYTYKGYRDGADITLRSGAPEGIVTADGRYQFIYEKQGSTKPPGGGSGNKGDPNPTEEDNSDENKLPDAGMPDTAEEPEAPEVPGLPENPEPGGPPDPEMEVPDAEPPKPEQGRSAGHQAANSTTMPALSAEARAELRNITFHKYSYEQAVRPGEEITYSFRGFANNFPYPLQEFTIVDQPDPGLDLITIRLPAFTAGAEVSYDIAYTTNQRPQEQILGCGYTANQPLTVNTPALAEEEHLTTITILFGEVPAGFGQGDELQMVFRVWEDPPADDLHNQGLLYYEELGEPVTRQSASEQVLNSEPKAARKAYLTQPPDDRSSLTRQKPETPALSKQNNRFSLLLISVMLALACGGTATTMWSRKRKT